MLQKAVCLSVQATDSFMSRLASGNRRTHHDAQRQGIVSPFFAFCGRSYADYSMNDNSMHLLCALLLACGEAERHITR